MDDSVHRTMSLSFRHPVPDDLETMTRIMNRSRKETAYHRDITLAEVNVETFEDTDYDTEGAWLVFDGEEAIAYAIAVVEKSRQEAGLDDGVIEIDVVPERRGEGVEEELIRLAIEYLKGRGVRRATARAEQTEPWKQHLLLGSDFSSVRHFYRMVCRGSGALPERGLPPGTTVSHRMLKDLTDAEVEEFSEVINDTFVDHFEFAPEPSWRWIKWRDACEEPWMVALAKSGPRNVALCITEDSRSFNAEQGVRSGWIEVLGVRKDQRGKGIGTAMLVDGMNWLRGMGHDTVHIGVDAENARALGLYKSVGFVVENESQAYHRILK